MSETKDWGRLARLAKQRRDDLGLTQLELATRASLSIDRIQAIEAARATSYSPRTLAKLERGLVWRSGSVKAILAGGDPTVEDADDLIPTDELAPTDAALLLRRFGHMPEVRAAIEKAAGGKREPRVGDDFAERIERILSNPAAVKRAGDLLRAARIPEIEEEEDRRGRDTG